MDAESLPLVQHRNSARVASTYMHSVSKTGPAENKKIKLKGAGRHKGCWGDLPLKVASESI